MKKADFNLKDIKIVGGKVTTNFFVKVQNGDDVFVANKRDVSDLPLNDGMISSFIELDKFMADLFNLSAVKKENVVKCHGIQVKGEFGIEEVLLHGMLCLKTGNVVSVTTPYLNIDNMEEAYPSAKGLNEKILNIADHAYEYVERLNIPLTIEIE